MTHSDLATALPDVPPEVYALLRRTSTATLTSQLFKRGFSNVFMQGPRPLTRVTANLVGPAFTLRYIPAREDLTRFGRTPDSNTVQRQAIETTPAGHVLVMDCRGETRAAAGGDILFNRMKARGVAGVVSDGAVRDSAPISAMDWHVYCQGASAPVNRIVHYALDINQPIGCGGVAVFPGDTIVADADGVVVIPRHLTAEVAHDAIEQEAIEQWVLGRIQAGEPMEGLYPLTDRSRAEYAAFRTRANEGKRHAE